jgi:hypothetical protein
MPRQRTRRTRFLKARTERDIRASVKDGSEEKRQLSRPIAVIAVEEHHNVRAACFSQSGQAGAPVSAARFA